MNTTGETFKKGLEKAYGQLPNLNADIMMDALKYKDMVENKKEETTEKWTEKYKRSIDCKNPKGFSQKAHCQGRKKKVKEEKLVGGKADKKTFEDLVNKNKKHGREEEHVFSYKKGKTRK